MSLVGNFLIQNEYMYKRRLAVQFFAIIAVYMIGTLLNSLTYMLYFPSIVSTIFLISFSYSLIYPPSTIEVFAKRLAPRSFDRGNCILSTRHADMGVFLGG